MSSQSEKIKFIKQCLKPIINQDVADDIVDYILTFTHEEDYQDFMNSMVDHSNPDHVRLYDQLRNKLFGTSPKKTKQQNANNGQNSQKAIINNQEATGSSNNKGKKTKFSNFYNHENKSGIRKGRHPCECQATKHELVNNCTKCGRIVCEQEGSGPCFFCQHMVCTRAEMELLNSNSKDSSKLYNHLMEQKMSKEWKRAVEDRNRLLQVDQMGSVQNRVFDDQNDYFDLNSKWASETEKSENKKRFQSKYEYLHKSKREFKLALDFASRTVVVEDTQVSNKKHLLKGVNKLLDNTDKRFPKNLFEGDKSQLIKQIVQLMEDSSLTHQGKSGANKDKQITEVSAKKFVTANDELLESIDQGMCLSMHQPWASLLVAGIKIHEGRTWKTDHRGRLWIAAAAKEPEDEEILACEEMYRELYNDTSIEFPKKYPTKCLLGCVNVDDCLDQETYRKKYGEGGESSSPYVLICSSPVILPMFYPMQGQHKIFALTKELHRTAKAALMSSKWI
ncbi:activating signal cointegrator 1 [Atheta coriaria]|uniref:activating signal cointegrator 1 n=1 Tax=Dalotia coriaria TaxID=877792 RepID=UPI0031F33A11